MNRPACFSGIKIFSICFLFIIFAAGKIYSDDSNKWTLAAKEFSFTQNFTKSESQKGTATLIPQLILEQMSTAATRLPPDWEMLDRKLNELQTERISFFLELSKAYKTRDSFILTENSTRSYKKKIAEQDKKILELKKKIETNLQNTKKAQLEFENRDEDPKGFFIFKKDTVVQKSKSEQISLYKNDSNQLFVPNENSKFGGIKSADFNNQAVNENINGLIDGRITIYSNFASVQAELFIFPGAKSVGVVTEVGSLSDCQSIAENLSRKLISFVTNSKPMEVFFSVGPEAVRNKGRIAVDGFVYDKIPESILVNSGNHTVEIYCDGYLSQSLNYNFKDSESFIITASLVQENNGEISVALKKPFVGTFYGNGQRYESTGADKVQSNLYVSGNSVIGQFLTDEHSVKITNKVQTNEKGKEVVVKEESQGPLIGSFFYIPSNLAKPDASLIVDVKPTDNSSNIDKRRIWMYRRYSAVICTLPLTFYFYGNQQALTKSSAAGIPVDPNVLSAVNAGSAISLGLTGLAGAFFIYEIVRYLKAADNVIPATARKVKPGEIEKSLELSQRYKIITEQEETIDSADEHSQKASEVDQSANEDNITTME